MYARCTILHGPADPESVEQGIKVVREQALPFVRGLEGFKGLLGFVDRENGKALTFTLWDSWEALDASEQRAAQVRSEVAEQTGDTIESVERYELAIDER